MYAPSNLQAEPESIQNRWATRLATPLLRRAFSIAGLKRAPDGVCVDVIYRVVGTASRWMYSLATNDPVSVLGPLGNIFPIHEHKPQAWLVAGTIQDAVGCCRGYVARRPV